MAPLTSQSLQHLFRVVYNRLCVPALWHGITETLMYLANSYDLPGSSAAAKELFQQWIVVPDGSRYFPGLQGHFYVQDVHDVHGAFLPHNPWILYLEWGSVSTPFLWLPAYGYCVHRGPLLHREKDFSFYQGCIRVCLGDKYLTPLIVIIIPHYLERRWFFQPWSTGLTTLEFTLPDVLIEPYQRLQWDWSDVAFGPCTSRQMEAFERLNQSWRRAKAAKKVIGREGWKNWWCFPGHSFYLLYVIARLCHNVSVISFCGNEYGTQGSVLWAT